MSSSNNSSATNLPSPTNHNSPFPSRPTIHRTPSGNARSSPRMAELSNLTRLKPISKSSPEVDLDTQQQQQLLNGKLAAADDHSNHYHRNNDRPNGNHMNRKAHRRNSMDSNRSRPVEYQDRKLNNVSYNRIPFDGNPVDPQNVPVHNNNNAERHQQPGTPKLAKSAQEKLRKLKEEQQRLSANNNNYNKHRSTENSHGEALSYNQLNLELDSPTVDHVDSATTVNNRPALSKKRKSKGVGSSRRNNDPFGPNGKDPFSKSSKVRNSNSFTSLTNDNKGDNTNISNGDPVSFEVTGNNGSAHRYEVAVPPSSPPLRRPDSNTHRGHGGRVQKSPSPPLHAPQGGGTFYDPDDRPIKPAKQNKWGARNGVDNHSVANDNNDQHSAGHHSDMVNGDGEFLSFDNRLGISAQQTIGIILF